MSDKEKIELEVLKGLLDDIKGMHPEYIIEYIEDQINIIKNGI